MSAYCTKCEKNEDYCYCRKEALRQERLKVSNPAQEMRDRIMALEAECARRLDQIQDAAQDCENCIDGANRDFNEWSAEVAALMVERDRLRAVASDCDCPSDACAAVKARFHLAMADKNNAEAERDVLRAKIAEDDTYEAALREEQERSVRIAREAVAFKERADTAEAALAKSCDEGRNDGMGCARAWKAEAALAEALLNRQLWADRHTDAMADLLATQAALRSKEEQVKAMREDVRRVADKMENEAGGETPAVYDLRKALALTAKPQVQGCGGCGEPGCACIDDAAREKNPQEPRDGER